MAFIISQLYRLALGFSNPGGYLLTPPGLFHSCGIHRNERLKAVRIVILSLLEVFLALI